MTTYTLAMARDMTVTDGSETIRWSADFRKMLRALNPPDPPGRPTKPFHP